MKWNCIGIQSACINRSRGSNQKRPVIYYVLFVKQAKDQFLISIAHSDILF